MVYSYAPMMASRLERLKQALEAHRQALEELQTALLEFEQTLDGQAPTRANGGGHQDLELLSVEEVCQGLGMGKSWVYRRLKSGEIPSVRLGRCIKVRRSDLEDYLDDRGNRPPLEE